MYKMRQAKQEVFWDRLEGQYQGFCTFQKDLGRSLSLKYFHQGSFNA